MDCNSCKESRATVSMAVFDRVMLNHNAIVKRLVVIIVLLIVLLVGSNAAWLWWESQWEDITETTITQDLSAEGGDAIINDGVHINGESAADSNN